MAIPENKLSIIAEERLNQKAKEKFSEPERPKPIIAIFRSVAKRVANRAMSKRFNKIVARLHDEKGKGIFHHVQEAFDQIFEWWTDTLDDEWDHKEF